MSKEMFEEVMRQSSEKSLYDRFVKAIKTNGPHISKKSIVGKKISSYEAMGGGDDLSFFLLKI